MPRDIAAFTSFSAFVSAPVSAKVSLATLKVADKAGNAADAAPRDDGLAAAASNAPP
jgi:hypothetical protein